MNQNRIRPGQWGTWPLWLALLAGACVLLSLGRLYANHFGTLLFTMLIGPLACCAAGLVLFETKLARQWEFRLLMGVLAVIFVCSALSEKFYGTFTENRNDLFVLVTLIFVCYALCFAQPSQHRRATLAVLIDVSAVVVSTVAAVGVVLAILGRYALPAFMPEYGIGICPEAVGMGADGRLVLFTHPNSTAMICEIVLLLDVYRCLTAKTACSKWLHGVSASICYLAIALAASRTATIAMCGGLALIACRFVLLKTVQWEGKKRFVRGLAAAAAFGGVLVIGYLINGWLCDWMLSLSPVNSMTAAAATAAERNILEDIGMFTGRTKLWRGAFQAMCDAPRMFLIGTSPICVGQAVSSYTPIYAQELHNSFVQMFVSGGVFCPLLFLAFLAMLGIHSVKLYFSGTMIAPCNGAKRARFVPAVAQEEGWLTVVLAAVLVNAFLETFLLIYPQMVFASVWFFILAGYVVCTAKDCSEERDV